jgi:hypothetical protein
MTLVMKTSDRDLAFAVALGILIGISLAAFLCDSHWRLPGDPRVSWTEPAAEPHPAGGKFHP